jgi:ketosteroid isomerase-like protein
MTTLTADVRSEIDIVVARFVAWMETGVAPAGLLADDCFADVTAPHWRIQVQGGEAVVASRRESHGFPGKVRVERVDRTERGFAIAFEERWEHEGQRWYCREQMTAEVRDGQITDIRYYCTGDWDEARQAAHAAEVTLIRP